MYNRVAYRSLAESRMYNRLAHTPLAGERSKPKELFPPHPGVGPNDPLTSALLTTNFHAFEARSIDLKKYRDYCQIELFYRFQRHFLLSLILSVRGSTSDVRSRSPHLNNVSIIMAVDP